MSKKKKSKTRRTEPIDKLKRENLIADYESHLERELSIKEAEQSVASKYVPK